MFRTRASVTLLVLIVLLAPTTARALESVVEYVYVEANEGGASGGHAALRLDDHTYHFQHHPPGILRLHRDDSQRFLYRYRMLENRTLHFSRLQVNSETAALLRNQFAHRYMIEGAQFETLTEMGEERELFARLLARQRRHTEATSSGAPITLRGLGFFFPDCFDAVGSRDDPTGRGRCSGAGHAAPLARLRQRIERVEGHDFIARRMSDIRSQVEHLDPGSGVDAAARTTDGQSPFAYPFARRFVDLTLASMALEVLRQAPALQPGTFVVPAGPDFVLAPHERSALQQFAEQLSDDLSVLVGSSRPDWGFAMLVGMARLVAVNESLELGRFVFLDAFPPEHALISHARLSQHREFWPDLLAEAQGELQQARTRLAAGAPVREAGYSQLEAAANRLYELQRSTNGGTAMRVYSGRLLPSRAARRADIVVPQLSESALTAALAETAAREDAYRAELHQRYRYDLITRNCVSEIFQTIAAAFSDDGADAHTASTRRLGGYIDPGTGLSFIPFVSAGAVQASYRIDDTRELPSYRHARLRDMYQREHPAVVYARESNVLTSTIYSRRDSRDSFFVFFTDDAWLARPLFGAVNLVSGLIGGTVGMALLPFDGGATARAGFKGALFSLPELAFFNVRKGTFAYVPRTIEPSSRQQSSQIR